MRIEDGKIEGSIRISDELLLNGIINGSVEVLAGGSLMLNGICDKDVTVCEGGTATLNGIVNGNVRNEGGRIEVHGTVNGSVLTVKGDTIIDKNAILDGRLKNNLLTKKRALLFQERPFQYIIA